MFERAEIDKNGLPRTVDPSTIALVAHVKNNDRRIRQYLSTLQNRVKSEHILIQIIASLVYMGEDIYSEVEYHCRRRLASIGNALRLTSSNSYGKLHNGEFLPYQDEIISLVVKPIDPSQDWRTIVSCTYQWHEQTNLNWELGNQEPIGINIIEINLVALLWVHMRARMYYRAIGEPINKPVLVQRHMINPMLASYMNISFFNHHRMRAKNIVPVSERPIATFPRPPLYNLALRGAREKQRVFMAQLFTPAELLYNIAQPFSEPGELGDARQLVAFDDHGQTFQGSWHKQLINWHLSLFCFQYNRTLMTRYHSAIWRELIVYEQQKVLEKFPKEMQQYYRTTLINPLTEIVRPK